ncbi:MAG: hypothetical protein MJ215_01120 [Spirochaetia bacterium]|nr:hypothetical protein [Spirochaetia bacterium]
MPGKKRPAGTKFQQVHVYHLLMNLSRLYTEFSMDMPKALLEVNQAAHGALFRIGQCIFLAANTPREEAQKKLDHLVDGQLHVKELYNAFYYMVNSKAVTHGGFEHLCSEAMKIYDELENWKVALYGKNKL